MKTFFYAFVSCLMMVFVIPACSVADDLDETTNQIEINASSELEDEDITAERPTVISGN